MLRDNPAQHRRFAALAEEARATGNARLREGVEYVYNLHQLGIDMLDTSLSTDQQVRLLKALPADDRRVPLFYDFQTKVNNVVALLDLIDNYEVCLENDLEAPWSGLMSHVYAQIDRDVLCFNTDIR